MYCHDLEVMSSSPNQAELGVRGTSVLSRTWTKHIFVYSLFNSLFHWKLMQKETHWQVGLQSLLAESTCVNQDVHQASWHCLNSKLVNTVHSSPYLMQSTMGSCYEWQAYDNGRHTIIIPSYLKQLQQDAYSVNVWHPKGCKSSRVMSKYIEVFFKLK